MENKPVTPVAAGLIIGLVSVILFLAYYFTGLLLERTWYSWIPSVIYVVLIIVFINMWSNANGNFVTFGSCFGYGFKTISIATLIVFFVTFIFIYVSPEYKVQMMNMIKTEMRSNKQMTDEQIDKGMEMVSKFFMISTLGGGLFGNLLIGTIGSLIGAAIAKKKPFDPFTQINQNGDLPS